MLSRKCLPIVPVIGVTLAMFLFLHGEIGRRYRSKLMWRPHWSVIRAQLMFGRWELAESERPQVPGWFGCQNGS